MNKFDEAIKVLYCDIYEINDFGDTNMFLSPDDALMIKKTLELGKLYKEYYDYFESQFNTDDVYVETLAHIKNKIKELENE